MPKYELDKEIIPVIQKLVFSGMETTYSSIGKGSSPRRCVIGLKIPKTKGKTKFANLILKILDNRRVKIEKSISGNLSIFFNYARNKTLRETLKSIEDSIDFIFPETKEKE